MCKLISLALLGLQLSHEEDKEPVRMIGFSVASMCVHSTLKSQEAKEEPWIQREALIAKYLHSATWNFLAMYSLQSPIIRPVYLPEEANPQGAAWPQNIGWIDFTQIQWPDVNSDQEVEPPVPPAQLFPWVSSTLSSRLNCDFKDLQCLLLIHLPSWLSRTGGNVLPWESYPQLCPQRAVMHAVYLKHMSWMVQAQILYIVLASNFHALGAHLLQHTTPLDTAQWSVF